MNSVAIKSADVDNLWRRLPWVLPTALLIWGILLWGFGLLLSHMADTEHAQSAITAELIKLHPPEKHSAVPSPPKPKPLRKTTPSQLSAPEQKPVVQTSSPTPAVPSIPAISLPATKMSGDQAVPYNMPSGVKSNAKNAQVSGGSIEPPQFGAAYLNNPKPAYPAFARRMGIQGTVMLKVLVSREGFALKIQVAQSSGFEILDNAAAETVKNWRFVPARQGDSPVDQWVQVPVAFHLNR